MQPANKIFLLYLVSNCLLKLIDDVFLQDIENTGDFLMHAYI